MTCDIHGCLIVSPLCKIVFSSQPIERLASADLSPWEALSRHPRSAWDNEILLGQIQTQQIATVVHKRLTIFVSQRSSTRPWAVNRAEITKPPPFGTGVGWIIRDKSSLRFDRA